MMEEKKYYDHLCGCGCGGRIEIKPWHKYNGIPRFIHGHNAKLLKGITKEINPNLIPSEKSKEKNRKAHLGITKEMNPNRAHTEKTKEILKKAHLGITKEINSNLAWPEERKERNRKSYIGKKKPKGFGERVGKALREKWQKDFEFREKQIKAIINGSVVRPNKLEEKTNKILQKFLPDEYLLNIKGDVIIGGKIPDFVNIKGQKKIIELFGDYWHSKEKTGRTKREEENQRIKHFAKYGYKTLVVWEHELKDMEKLKKKILHFYYE